jgi:hypothetical protein
MTTEKVTCKKCNYTFAPSFSFDFYQEGPDPRVGLCEKCMMAETFAGKLPKGDPSPLPAGYQDTVCKDGQAEAACSFLAFGEGTCQCLKGSAFEAEIRKRREEGSIRSMGDNCSGPPGFKPTTGST